MEFLMIFSFHYFIMGSLVLLISGAISFLFTRIHFTFIVLLSMLAGLIYSFIIEVRDFAIFSVIFNGALSLLGIGLVKAGLYAKQKAEDTDKMNPY
ncbi:hypothetical protein [Neobacillus sp. YIM B06451]|uniref:hypothetical protein n=1 Tax=Neobacillus sp. YIM B06451 TaxID=3070994 RepID=UPI002930690C|nr:hypothetical protein [Neobacillus sp. YIM B06451]